MSNRLVFVDDANTDIQYSGPWFAALNNQLNTGTNGPPFQNTLHGVDVNASLSYSFSGSHVIVLGTSIISGASWTQDPSWECFIDNISIGWNKSAGALAENSWVFCESDLQDGPHVLSVHATVLHRQTFWFDQIQYLPSSNVTNDNSTVRVDSSDPAIQYSSGWTELDGIVNLTQTAGSTVTYHFFGVSLSWFGFVPSNFSLTSASAIYSIDGQTPTSFFVPALSASNAQPLYNQLIFKTVPLSPGQHELLVTYQGNSGTAPLALDVLAIQNATSPSTTSSSTTSSMASVPSSSSSNSTSNLGSKTSPLVYVIVGVVGAIVLVLGLLLLLYIRRRIKLRAQKLKGKNFNTIPDPYTFTSEITSLIPQPISSKFSRRRESANASSSESSSPTPPLMQSSTSAKGGDLGYLLHADSGVRMPPAESNLEELPPIYTSG